MSFSLHKILKKKVKLIVGFLLASLFRSKCFPLFGRATGLTSLPTVEQEGLLTIQNGFATQYGAVLDNRGKLITTFFQPIEGKKHTEHELLILSSKRFFPKIGKSDLPLIVSTGGWQDAFYHWFYEILPKFDFVEEVKLKEYSLYLSDKYPFQKESLELLNLPFKKLFSCQTFEAVFAPTVILPSTPSHVNHRSCHYLREKFLPHLTSTKRKRLYISREDATKRRILNEEALFKLLKDYHFEKVTFSNLPLLEQMNLFYNAEAIVAPHGAALTHLTFAAKNTFVLELFAPPYHNTCYQEISNILSLNYHPLFGTAPNGGSDPDILIDLDKVSSLLTKNL